MSIKLAPEIVTKKSSEVKKVDFEFEKEFAASEVVSNVDASSVAPTDEMVASVASLGDTAVQMAFSSGLPEKAFTAAASTDIFTSTSHGLTDGHTVHLIIDGVNDLPSGFDDEIQYYIINSTTDTFQLALISGGTAVSVTDDGQGRVGVDYKVTVTVITSFSQTIDGEGFVYIRD